MDELTSLFAPLVGRILIGGFFLWNAILAAINLAAFVEIFINMNVPQPIAVAILAIAVEALSGLAVITDFQTRPAALVLILCTLASSVALSSSLGSLETQLLLEHLAIVGGLLYVVAYASDRKSAPRRRR